MCGQVPEIVFLASQLAVCKELSSMQSSYAADRDSRDMSSGKFGLLYAQRWNWMGFWPNIAVEHYCHHCCILHGFTPVSYIDKLHLFDIIYNGF